jgi:hypothetical protein
MSNNTPIETCEWDTGCPSVATRHVRWIVGQNNDTVREKHLCDAHTADLHERPCGGAGRARSPMRSRMLGYRTQLPAPVRNLIERQ